MRIHNDRSKKKRTRRWIRKRTNETIEFRGQTTVSMICWDYAFRMLSLHPYLGIASVLDQFHWWHCDFDNRLSRPLQRKNRNEIDFFHHQIGDCNGLNLQILSPRLRTFTTAPFISLGYSDVAPMIYNICKFIEKHFWSHAEPLKILQFFFYLQCPTTCHLHCCDDAVC